MLAAIESSTVPLRKTIWTLCRAKSGARFCERFDRLESGLHGYIKRLRRADAAYRLRMGDYRILFDVEGEVIVIRGIGDRKQIYD